MDWLCTVEFIPEDNGEARLFATEIVGHLFGYAQATNTRALALVGDADANAYELLFYQDDPYFRGRALDQYSVKAVSSLFRNHSAT